MIAVLIIGILTAIAMPRYFEHIKRTQDKTHQIKLMMLRDAIERYIVEHDRELPPSLTAAAFKSAIEPYLGDAFPGIELDLASLPDNFDPTGVNIVSSVSPVSGDLTPTHGWKYNSETGRIIVNIATDSTALDPAKCYDDW